MSQRVNVAFLFFGILGVAYIILIPGISGPLILDDYPFFRHLPNKIENYTDFFKWVYLGGFELGRAPALASFLINGLGYPPDTEAYKHTNLLIHLLNSVLVFYFVFLVSNIYLSNALKKPKYAVYYALIVMGLWVISPLLESSVFMTIQRMTLLMSTFQLIGLIFYINGRVRLKHSVFGGYFLMTLGVAFFGVLAALTKENGILICGYILVLESTLLKGVPWCDRYRMIWKLVVLWLPLVLLVLYMAHSVLLGQGYERRDFDLVDRVLWQAHILLLYLSQLISPRIGVMGPYHDGMQYSSNVIGSALVLFPVIVVIALAYVAIRFRNKYTVLSYSILWFLCGHLLESTVLPLELYFEHRNYLPSISVFFLIASIFFYFYKINKGLSLFVIIVYASLVSLLSFQQAKVWADEELQSLVWSEGNPYSTRSSFQVMKYWVSVRDYGKLEAEYLRIVKKRPEHLGVRVFGFFGNDCLGYKISGADSYQSLKAKVASWERDFLAFNMMESLKKKIKEGRCGVTFQQYRALVEVMLGNSNYATDHKGVRILYTHIADTFVYEGDLMSALGALEKAYKVQNDYSLALSMSKLSLQLGNLQAAADYLEVAKNTPHKHYYELFWQGSDVDEWGRVVALARTEFPGEENIWQVLMRQGRLPEAVLGERNYH